MSQPNPQNLPLPQSTTPEQRLQAYWGGRPEITNNNRSSDWDDVVRSVKLRDGLIQDSNASLQSPRSAVTQQIAEGLPLTRAEYYFALACGFLMGDRPYEEFFRERWHETSTHRGYGPATTCARCEEEQRGRPAPQAKEG